VCRHHAIIVIGGGIATSLRTYVPRLQRALEAAVPVPPRVELSRLEDRAVAIGAVRRGIQQVESSVFERLGAGVPASAGVRANVKAPLGSWVRDQ
jgi:hypothetical protein